MAALPAELPGELPVWDVRGFGEACDDGELARVQDLTRHEHMVAHSGVDLNAAAHFGWTGLCCACYRGRIDVVRHLTSPAMLAAGIDVNKGDEFNISPLAMAAAQGRVEVVRHLLESPDLRVAGSDVDVNAASTDGWTALHRACDGNAPLEVVSLLLRQPGLSIGSRDKLRGCTALQMAEAKAYGEGHGAEKAALIRDAMRLIMARRYVLMVAMRSRREGCAATSAAAAVADADAGVGAGARAGAGAAAAVRACTSNDEARGRRGVMGSLPPHLLRVVSALASGV